MQRAVLAIVLVLGLIVAGRSQAQGLLSNIMAELGIGGDKAEELDSLNSVMGAPLSPDDEPKAYGRGPRRRTGVNSGYSGTNLRIPAAPSPLFISSGASICRTDAGSCAVNVLAAAGQACWCPTLEGYASGKVAAP